jgi:hypothetical protein
MGYLSFGTAVLLCATCACSSAPDGLGPCIATPYSLGAFQGSLATGQNISASNPLGCHLEGLPTTVLGFTPPSTAGLFFQAVGTSSTPVLTLTDAASRVLTSSLGGPPGQLAFFPSVSPFELFIMPLTVSEASGTFALTVSPLTQGGCNTTSTTPLPFVVSGAEVASTITWMSCPQPASMRSEWFGLFLQAGQVFTAKLSSPSSGTGLAAVLWDGPLTSALAQTDATGTMRYTAPAVSSLQLEVTLPSVAAPVSYTLSVSILSFEE